MNVNEKWFAQLPGSSKVQTIQIKEITTATVLIADLDCTMFGISVMASRYPRYSIKLLEQLPDDYEYTYANLN